MPVQKLNNSQTMTIGAQAEATFVVPNGCTRKSRTKIAHETPMIVGVVMLDEATVSPWIAPSTDWAGVKTPSMEVVSLNKHLCI